MGTNVVLINLTAPPLLPTQGNTEIVGTVGNQNNIDITNWGTYPYFTDLPEQIAGFNPLYPCDYSDCRDTSTCGYLSPVFGSPNVKTSTYENDISTFMVSWGNYSPTWVIQKQNQKWFGFKNAQGSWINVATITNNIYGVYLPIGSVPNNPTWSQFSVNWGAVVNAFGPGIYRISVSNCNGGSYSSQATLTIVIPSTGFPKLIQGTFTIGSVSYPLYYYGSYSAYLNYLAAQINTQGTYAAVTTATGLIISGKNGILSNGKTVSQTLFNTSTAFDVANLGGYFPISSTTSPATLNINPFIPDFNDIYLNYGGNFNISTGKWTAGTDDIQIFSGYVNFISYTLINNIVNTGPQTSAKCTVSLIINGVAYNSQVLNGVINSGNINIDFSFPPTDGQAGHPPKLHSGDQVWLECVFQTGFTQGKPQVTGRIWPQAIGFQNQSAAKGYLTTYGTLSGGSAFVPDCFCASASQPYLLRAWDCNAARGTVKFESNITGTIGDAYNDGNLFAFNGYTLYDSIRVPGFLGNMDPKMEEVVNEWGSSLNEPFGFQDKVRGRLVPNNKFMSKLVPFWVYRGILQYAFLPSGGPFIASDYNSNNANFFIMQKLQKLKGEVKTTYLNKGHFAANENWRNRMLKFDCTLEDGIQSGIATTCNI